MPLQKVTIQSVVEKSYTRDGQDKKLYVCVIGGKEYVSFDAGVVALAGKEADLEVFNSKGKDYVKIPGADGKPPFKPGAGKSFGRSPEDLALTARTMSASYAKDLVVGFVAGSNLKQVEISFKRMLEAFGEAYDTVYGKIMTGHAALAPAPAAEKPSASPKAETPSTKPPAAPAAAPAAAPKGDPSCYIGPFTKTAQGRICPGVNKKMEGKDMGDKFCKECYYHRQNKCNPFAAPQAGGKPEEEPPLPLEPKGQPPEPETIKKDFTVPQVEDKGYQVAMANEMRRVGMKAHFKMLEDFGFSYADEVPPEKRNEILAMMKTLPKSDIPF